MSAPVRSRPRRVAEGPSSRLLALAVLGTVVVAPIGLAVSVDRSTYDVWGAFVWAPVLLGLCVPLSKWVARRTGEPSVAAFVLAAAFLKIIVGTGLRYATAHAFYGGLADADRYDRAGTVLATQFRDGAFGDLGKVTGTRLIDVFSGLVQAVIGDSQLGVFLVFSFVGFVGMVLLYVAFCDALPHGDRRLYRLLLFLTPTIWYWPSSIGKEAAMLLFLGIAAFGAARVLCGSLSGLIPAALGLWGVVAIRPHMALVFMVGVAVALPALQRRGEGSGRNWALLVVPVVLALTVPLVLGAFEGFLGLDSLDPDSAEEAVSEVARRTTQGGSEYATTDPFTPAGLVVGTATALYRPLPWEAPGVQGLVSSVEMTALAGVCIVSMWRRRSGLVNGLRQRYTRFGLGYTLSFSMAFATVGNFGILVRQRSLLLPFAFIVVACASRASKGSTLSEVEA